MNMIPDKIKKRVLRRFRKENIKRNLPRIYFYVKNLNQPKTTKVISYPTEEYMKVIYRSKYEEKVDNSWSKKDWMSDFVCENQDDYFDKILVPLKQIRKEAYSNYSNRETEILYCYTVFWSWFCRFYTSAQFPEKITYLHPQRYRAHPLHLFFLLSDFSELSRKTLINTKGKRIDSAKWKKLNY